MRGDTLLHITDRHDHAQLASRLGLGDHAYVLPLVYSLLAGLSTGIGGMLCLLLRGSTAMELPLTAFMLSTAAAAMITVSIVDLFMHIAEEIGLTHTLLMSLAGALTGICVTFLVRMQLHVYFMKCEPGI